MSTTGSSISHENRMPLKTYLPGLSELRALAALSVIPGHIEEIKQIFNFPNNYWFPIPGNLAVILFFSISGFLITTLLLKEKAKTNRISVKQFYINRMLRIAPLYFLVVGGCILAINKIHVFQMPILSSQLYENINFNYILLLFLMLPNYSVIIPYAGQTWSIGIEMQFYLIQPFAIKITRSALRLIVFMLSVVFLKEMLLFVNHIFPSAIVQLISSQSVYFGCVAIGCLGAIMCDMQPKYFYIIIHHRWTQVVALLFFIVFLILIRITHNEQVIDLRFHAVLFTIMVINASTNPLSFYNLKNSFLNYLGKISYGIYMYHAICIGIAIAIGGYYFEFFRNHVVLFDVFIYCSSVIFTIILSSLSFKYFESFFLSLKRKEIKSDKADSKVRMVP